MELIKWLHEIIIMNTFVLKCQVLLGLITDIINFECFKRTFQVYLTVDISKTVCLVVHVFHQYKDITKGFQQMKYGRLQQQTAWEYAKCFMWHFLALVPDFRGSKNDVPLSKFSKLCVCSLYALEVPNDIERVNVAICSHFLLDWLAYQPSYPKKWGGPSIN